MAGQQTAAPAAKRPILLRSAEEFCDAFFHVKETPEAGIAAVGCLRSGEKCRGKTTCLIARLMAVEGKGEDFLRIYYNHARNSCAEGFLIQDRDLIAYLDCYRQGSFELHLFLTQQPCHFSSSNDANSCTENLLRWWKENLKPKGVQSMRIAAAYPYRTHWNADKMSEDELATLGRRKWAAGGSRGSQDGRGWRGGGGGFGRGSGYMRGRGESEEQRPQNSTESIARARQLLENAREGTRRLVAGNEEGLELRAFTAEDWAFVLSCTAPEVGASYTAGSSPFSEELKARRSALDTFTKQVFDGFKVE